MPSVNSIIDDIAAINAKLDEMKAEINRIEEELKNITKL